MQKKIFLILISILSINSAQAYWWEKEDTSAADKAAQEKREMRAGRSITNMSNMFVPQGQWVMGANFSFSTHTNNNYDFTLIEGINSEGHTIDFSPLVAYTFAKNMSAGVRASYSRTFLSINSAALTIGEGDSQTNITVDEYYSLRHIYSGSLIWRFYIPLGKTKRFALFNEAQLTFSGGQSKFARDQPVKGTYQTHFGVGLGLCPGVVAFATNNIAVEINVGVLGIGYDRTEQVHNQVTVGEVESSSLNYKVNILSINLGVSFYL